MQADVIFPIYFQNHIIECCMLKIMSIFWTWTLYMNEEFTLNLAKYWGIFLSGQSWTIIVHLKVKLISSKHLSRCSCWSMIFSMGCPTLCEIAKNLHGRDMEGTGSTVNTFQFFVNCQHWQYCHICYFCVSIYCLGCVI